MKTDSNKIKENSNTVRHLIMGQITTTQNLVAIKEVRHAGQKSDARPFLGKFLHAMHVVHMNYNFIKPA